MERINTMKHAAVNHMAVVCAATFAATLITLSAAPAAAEGCVAGQEELVPVLCGTVTDSNGPVGDVTVEIRNSSGTTTLEVADTVSCAGGQPCGNFKFIPGLNFDLPPGTYILCAVPNNAECGDTETIVVTLDGDGNPLVKTSSSSTNPVPSLVVDFSLAPPPGEVWGDGTGTPGYWKNHPEAWPGPVTIGGVTYLNQKTAPAGQFTKYDAIKLMGKVGGDKTITLFSSLLSAKLNNMAPLHNNTVCIDATVPLADAWMSAHPVGSGVKASSPAWTEGEPWHQKLDDYNNGKLCAPHRD